MRLSTARGALPAALVLAVALAVAGCGQAATPSPSASPSGSANPATPDASTSAGDGTSPSGSVPAPAAASPAPPASSPSPAAGSPSGAPPDASPPAPAASPTPGAPPTPLAFGHASLQMDHAAATSDRGQLYSRPLQGCRPTGFGADPARSSFTVSPDGTLAAHCELTNATGTIDGDLTGAIDLATGAVTFTLVTKTVYAGAKPATFALTFQGTGRMDGDASASGIAAWTMECTAGTAKCSFDPAHAQALTASGTVPWTLSLLP
jgi:hypothetical protein